VAKAVRIAGCVQAEGSAGYGQISKGDKVTVYRENGRLKYENARVVCLRRNNETYETGTVAIGDGTSVRIQFIEEKNHEEVQIGDIVCKEELLSEAAPAPGAPKAEGAPPVAGGAGGPGGGPGAFRMTVTAARAGLGGAIMEGGEGVGRLRLGDKVFVYGKRGRLKCAHAAVTKLIGGAPRPRSADALEASGGVFPGVMLDFVKSEGDIEAGDILSKESLPPEAFPKEPAPKEAAAPPERGAPAGAAPGPGAFRMTVCDKFTGLGGVFAEGKEGRGQIKKGDKVFVYGADGRLKFENAAVVSLLKGSLPADSAPVGGGNRASVMLDRAQYLGDIDKGDIISAERLEFSAPPAEAAPEPKPEKILPPAKTYNNPDRKIHIVMATNDLRGMAASGTLDQHRQWVRDVGQDLYDAHGFEAMREVFLNVKTRCPEAQRQLSALWDGVGGWAG
jgi:hypothetical protein